MILKSVELSGIQFLTTNPYLVDLKSDSHESFVAVAQSERTQEAVVAKVCEPTSGDSAGENGFVISRIAASAFFLGLQIRCTCSCLSGKYLPKFSWPSIGQISVNIRENVFSFFLKT